MPVARKSALLISIMLFAFLRVFAQETEVHANHEPLNNVLVRLATTYNLQISFDDNQLAQYSVTLEKTFPSPAAAVAGLLEGLPLQYELSGNVFVIFPAPAEAKMQPEAVTGRVLDRLTGETLPYAHVILNGQGIATDLKGSFSFPVPADTLCHVTASHLGYYILDTLITLPASFDLLLTPSVVGLSEIVVTGALVSTSDLIGREAGTMKLNHQVANFLPGFGDNSVFNLLRLQPGILASGEQTNDLIIWGCYEGQSKTMFDGFTVYSLKNFNDNISAFNPLMAKDIEVHKGGYDARYGDRVGGIVNVTGKNGNMVKPSFTLNVNNMTLNGMVEVPVAKNHSLVLAFRSTYYELYNPTDVNAQLWRNNDNDTANDADYNIIPDYRFSDLNLKYSTFIGGKDLFYISLYGGRDRFSYSIDEPLKLVTVQKETAEKNVQAGGAAFYGKNWHNGASTNFSLNYSSLEKEYTDELSVTGKNGYYSSQVRDESSVNSIREYTFSAEQRFKTGRYQQFEGGIDLKSNRVVLREDTFNVVQAHLDDVATRTTLYLQDQIHLTKDLSVKPGIRINRSFNLKQFFFEPRLSLTYEAGEHWRLNAAWGIYDQFIAESSVVDDLGNIRYIWTVCDNLEVPVLKSMHVVGGIVWEQFGFTVSLEPYYKSTTGLTRFVRNNMYHEEGIFEGKGRSYGADLMVKKDYRGHSAWISYSLSRTEELFEYFLDDTYRRAPQDQRHEVKAALLLNFDPFYFSADYVYGSGFPAPAYLGLQHDEDLTYSRLDVAVIYKFLDRKVKGEVGLSVLNVLNTENIKYENFERIPSSQTNSISLYAEAIPLTPALYLKLSL